ncbi:MAG: phosphatase PAP2 family protein [Candidatus Limnocylindria bacterium]
MTELLAALAEIDRQLYLAVTSSRNQITAFLAVGFALANTFGLVWWLFGLAGMRSRGLGRRGLSILLTVAIGLASAWIVADIVKAVLQRPRPFDVLEGVEVLITRPVTFGFPSGDTAGAFGAAVALGFALPRLRWLALLIASGIALARVAVGVHWPSDVLGGAAIGIAVGSASPWIVAEVQRRLPWAIHVVPHTHWDREWYARFDVYRERLVRMVGRLLDLLERDLAFTAFTFDGQTIAVEDHLAKVPADRPRIEKLVREDRLLIGPWYVLADYLLVSGESIVRNFQEGLRVAGELGRAMRVCYVADPFGHPAQMPQIVRGFGYVTYVFARGVGDEGEELGSEFQWEAPSGDRVLASHQVAHYDNALPLVGDGEEDGAALRRRVRRVLPRLMRLTGPYAQSPRLLFMVGTDHTEPYERLPEAVAAISAAQPRSATRITGLESFALSLPTPRGVLTGEMIAGKYRPILRGVNSTRVLIKQANSECERLLLERCEPLDALTGGGARERIRSLWRTLLENHPHDSISGCGIDGVHDLDMRPRFERVARDGEALAAELTARVAGSGEAAVLWSALPWERRAVVDVAGRPTLVRTAGLGVAPPEPVRSPGVRSPEDGVLENGDLRVEVAADGTFAVADMATGHRWGPQNRLVSDGDRGDEYTFSYAGPTVAGAASPGSRRTEVRGDRGTVTVDTVMRLPAALRPDRLARVAEMVECPLRVTVTLDARSDRVEVETLVENRARDHRLRADFDTGTRTLTHHAGAAFALLERPNRVPPRPGWVEPPTPERCLHDVVGVHGVTSGLAVGVDGLREYTVLRDGGTIGITLLRAVGWLSRGDLRERRGHAGPEIETPTAQCIGPQRFRYCVVPLRGEARAGTHWSFGRAIQSVREFLSPPLPGRGDGTGRTLLRLETDPPGSLVQLSSLRAGPEGDVVVRLAAMGPGETVATLRFDRPVASARATDLREGLQDLGNTGLETLRTAAPLEIAPDGAARARVGPYDMATWLIRLQ